MDSLGSDRRSFLLKSIGALIQWKYWTDQRTSTRPLQQAIQYTSDQCGDGHRNHKPDQ
jgi:hypothetical protein